MREPDRVEVREHLESYATSVTLPPTISVIMSVHNCARYVAQAIESILDQSLRGFEFIIVDDFSDDGSDEICQRFASADRRIMLLRNDQHLGLTRSLNKALGLARSKYIARMDADDVSLPRRFELQMQYLESNTQIGLVGSYYYEIDENGDVATNVVQFSSDPIIVHWRMAIENPIPHPPIMVRKELVDRVGGYDERWGTSQDYDLFTRLCDETKLSNYPKVLFHWRRHGESVSATQNERQRSSALEICSAYLLRLLGRELSLEALQLLWTRTPKTVEEAAELWSLCSETCRAVSAQARWSTKERALLRRYVAQKGFSYVRSQLVNARSWPIVVRLAFQSPRLFVVIVTSRFRRQPNTGTAID